MISRLHYISQEPHLLSILEACEAGCDLVQLRAKNLSEADYLKLAIEAKAITDRFGAKLIVNDQPQVALRANAFGVHLGKEDMDPAKAREIVGENGMIGASSNTLEDILRLADKGVNYVGLGPFRFTHTKSNLNPVLGLAGIAQIVNGLQQRHIILPVIAIGGITIDDVDVLRQAGIFGVAVSGEITRSADKKNLVSAFQQKLILPY